MKTLLVLAVIERGRAQTQAANSGVSVSHLSEQMPTTSGVSVGISLTEEASQVVSLESSPVIEKDPINEVRGIHFECIVGWLHFVAGLHIIFFH